MTKVELLHDAFLERANHTDSQYLEQLAPMQRDYYLNRGKDIVIELLSRQDERDDTYRRALSELVKRGQSLTQESIIDNLVTFKWPADFYKQKALRAVATRSGCGSERELIVRRPTSEKFLRARKNPVTRRIWDFEETFAQELAGGIQAQTEPGVSLELFLDYIRRVPDIAAPSLEQAKMYVTADGRRITQNADLDFDEPFWIGRMVAMAVLEAQRNYGRVQDYQAQKDHILFIDRT